jgi:putative DNA primase/helicase
MPTKKPKDSAPASVSVGVPAKEASSGILNRVAPAPASTDSVPPPAGKPSGLPQATPRSWRNLLIMGQRGAMQSCAANVALILTHEPAWQTKNAAGESVCLLAYDEFVGDIIATAPPPWPADICPQKPKIGDWSEEDMIRCGVWLARSDHRLVASAQAIKEGVRIVAARRTVHPLRDWLAELGKRWDGVSRVDEFFIEHGGAEDSLYTRAASAIMFNGAVARAFEPGAKFDCMVVIEGEQGWRKSSAVRELASEEWFLETNVELGANKDSYQDTRRKWIVEVGEMDGITRAEVGRVKFQITKRVDRYRPSYGTASIDFPRQFILVGTINPIAGSGYLKDETGARRFYPVKLTRAFDIAKLRKVRDQLWAEAVVRYLEGEKPYTERGDVLAIHREQTEERRQAHPLETPAAAWLAKLSAKRKWEGITTYDLLTEGLGHDPARLTRSEEMTAATILRVCGWTYTWRPCESTDHAATTRPRRYRHPDAEMPKAVPLPKPKMPSVTQARGPYAKGEQVLPEPANSDRAITESLKNQATSSPKSNGAHPSDSRGKLLPLKPKEPK